MRRATFCLFLILLSGSLAAMPEKLRQAAPGWQILGQGEMRWFGFKLYAAQLWARGDAWSFDEPFALKLTYARELEGRRIVDASVDEMRKLGYADEVQLARWREYMASSFPDVRAGDSLTGVFMPGRGLQFWLGERLLREVSDEQFARAFFAIWLDPRTREPDLRLQLLGQR